MLLGLGRQLSCLPVLLTQLRSYSSQSTTEQLQQGTVAVQSEQTVPVQRLTKQQKEDVKAILKNSFKQDSAGAASLLAKTLDDDAKKQLLLALEAALEPPELSRAAMAGGIAADAPDPAQQQEQQQQQRLSAEAAVAASLAAKNAELPQPTFQQLLRVGVVKGIPFVAFGFFDNLIMITAGEQIDLMFGAKLGLSSMAAAGLGNTIADVVGINISHTIEQKFKSMQHMAPALTKAQMKMPQTKRAAWLGCALGMGVGCLLGLTPLLFFGDDSHHKQQQQQQQLDAAETGRNQPATAAG